MTLTKKMLVISVMLPIIILIAMVANVEYQIRTGDEIELPIHGYDPRDLLSGYYLTYQVDYGIETCLQNYGKREGYVCLSPREFSFDKPKNCITFIRGMCNNAQFDTGIDRFYTSENNAKELERIIGQQPMSIILSISSDGTARVKYLIVDGERWN